MDYKLPEPVDDCKGCSGTGGIYNCPIHSPNIYARKNPIEPFVLMYLRCPWCGKDMEFQGYKTITINSRSLE